MPAFVIDTAKKEVIAYPDINTLSRMVGKELRGDSDGVGSGSSVVIAKPFEYEGQHHFPLYAYGAWVGALTIRNNTLFYERLHGMTPHNIELEEVSGLFRDALSNYIIEGGF